MEKRKKVFCAWVNGDVEDLNRATLREEFSKFGGVTKIFIDSDTAYAKVYLDEIENLKRACLQLNGFKSWEVTLHQDNFRRRHDFGDGSSSSSFTSRSCACTNRSTVDMDYPCASCNGNSSDMEKDCTIAEEYVDVHGKPVMVLQADNGELYVNLDDVRMTGFNVYKKESFENAIITKDVELKHLEIFLLNQAKKYVLSVKQTFNENEMMGVFERVQAKLQAKPPGGEFGDGRLIQSAPKSKNFTITKSNVPSAAEGDAGQKPSNRAPKELPENFQPSFSYKNARPNRDDRRSGPPTANGYRRSQNSFDDRNERNDDRRKTFGNDQDFAKAASFGHNPTHMRKPKFSEEAAKNFQSKVMGENRANEEPEESWEGVKTSVPKAKSHSDTGSVSNEKKSLSVERTVLAPNSTYKVRVSYINPDKKTLFYAQCFDDLNRIEEILLHVNTTDLNLPEIAEPARDMLCVANFEDCWYRAVVLHGNSGGGPYVELIDYGNKENIKTPLREISAEMKKIPGMAIRIAVHQTAESENLTLNTEKDIEVFVRKHYDDQTHLVEIRSVSDGLKLNEEPPTPPNEVNSDSDTQQKSQATSKSALGTAEECFTQIPPSTAKLNNGESVMIVGYEDDKFILRNKETATNCKAVYSHLLGMDKKPTIASPKVGQLVLCSRDGMEGLHRAVITKIDNLIAVLEYLDYFGGETLSLKSLRNVDKTLATYPSGRIKSPVFNSLPKVTDKSEPLLNELIVKKTKLKVVLDGSNFDLQLTEGDKTILLSQMIDQLENPRKREPEEPVAAAPPKREETRAVQRPPVQPPPNKEEPAGTVAQVASKVYPYVAILYDEMPFVTPKKGEDQYICYSCQGHSVTLLSTTDAGEYLEDIEVGEPTDTTPYAPELFEMCLAKFQEVWYRATVAEIEDETFKIHFVDYGNAEHISKTDVRKLPKKLSKIPILGINAFFMGIPDELRVHTRLKELIPDETVLTVDVKTDLNEELKYGVEVPSIYAVLKNEKLI